MGGECWFTDKTIHQALRGFHIRSLARIVKTDPQAVQHTSGLPDIMRLLCQRRWLWLGRLLRMNKDEVVSQAFRASISEGPSYPYHTDRMALYGVYALGTTKPP